MSIIPARASISQINSSEERREHGHGACDIPAVYGSRHIPPSPCRVRPCILFDYQYFPSLLQRRNPRTDCRPHLPAFKSFCSILFCLYHRRSMSIAIHLHVTIGIESARETSGRKGQGLLLPRYFISISTVSFFILVFEKGVVVVPQRFDIGRHETVLQDRGALGHAGSINQAGLSGLRGRTSRGPSTDRGSPWLFPVPQTVRSAWRRRYCRSPVPPACRETNG